MVDNPKAYNTSAGSKQRIPATNTPSTAGPSTNHQNEMVSGIDDTAQPTDDINETTHPTANTDRTNTGSTRRPPGWSRPNKEDIPHLINMNYRREKSLNEEEKAALAAEAEMNDHEDDEICEGVLSLLQDIITFSKSFEPFSEVDLPKKEEYLLRLLKPENKRLVRYVGYLTNSGAGRQLYWANLFFNTVRRRGLVVGIISHALREHVFEDLWFGGSEEEKAELFKMEVDQVDDNGKRITLLRVGTLLIVTLAFYRSMKRAEVIAEFPMVTIDNEQLDHACTEIQTQIEKLLAPLWRSETFSLWDLPLDVRSHFHTHLSKIVKQAASLSRSMRQNGKVVYSWQDVFKDTEFAPADMEFTNRLETMENNPYEKDQGSRPVLKSGQEDRPQAIVQIVCFPGLIAYRGGGGPLAEKELEAERATRPPGKRGSFEPNCKRSVRMEDHRLRQRSAKEFSSIEGYRSRTLCKSVVVLRWGKQRLLTRTAGTYEHRQAVKDGNMAKYEEDEFHHWGLYETALKYWDEIYPEEAFDPKWPIDG